MNNEIGIALIGCGYWGKNLARNISGIKGFSLKMVYDLNEENRNHVTKKIRAPVGEDYKQIWERDDITAVAIAVTTSHHFEIAREALLNDRDVFVEKPLALSVKDGEELVKLAKEKNKILMVGHLLKYHPSVRWIKKYLSSGEMGDIYYLYTERLNLGRVRSDENALFSLSPHDISVMLYFLDSDPVEVSARGEGYIHDGIEDVIFFTLRFGNKVLGHIHVSWLDPHKTRKMTLVGRKKMLIFDDVEEVKKVKIYETDYKHIKSKIVVAPPLDLTEPLKLECLHFLECLRKRQSPLSDGMEGVKVLKVLEAAQISLKNSGKPVKI